MSISAAAIAEVPLALPSPTADAAIGKVPPKRQMTATRDAALVPEPR